MEIRFISSLTAEDENFFAPALLKAVGALLDQLPIAYTLRIETTGAQVLQHSHSGFVERSDDQLDAAAITKHLRFAVSDSGSRRS